MKTKSVLFSIFIAFGIGSVFASSPCENRQTYNTGAFVPPTAAVFSRSPLPYLGLGSGPIMGRTDFPNGVLMIQWPTPITNYLLLPMDYPWADAIASGATKAAEEGHNVQVQFCFDPTNSNVRLIDYVLFSR